MKLLGHKFGNDGVGIPSPMDTLVIANRRIVLLDLLQRPSEEVSALRPNSSLRTGMDHHSTMDYIECSLVR